MNKYIKSSIIGISVYLLIFVVYFGIFVNKPNEFLLTILAGPFIWVPLLIYPGIILLTTIFVLNKINSNISLCFISSSIIIFGFGLLLSGEYFKDYQNQKHLNYFFVAAISCFIGFIYAKWRTPNKPN
jgi:membrane protein DedA with SNARE-associated domain